jgi:hypothetical protein
VGLVSDELGGACAPRRVCAVARGASRSARRFRPRRLFLHASFFDLPTRATKAIAYRI